MRRIKVLPQLLIDKIAAGEVIERPASVAKELIENSIDAGATQIKIEAEDGGKKLIRVTDDGAGIASDELSLVFASHATNKIETDTDLYHIDTLGFRGEALASIAAVAQVKMISQPAGQAEAWEVTIQSGQSTQPQPSAGARGASVEVRNLFFNIPARAKFLKSTSVELSHLSEIITRYALAYHKIRFDFIHNRENVVNLLPADNLIERIGYFFGQDIGQSLIKATSDQDKINLVVYASNPAYTKPNSRGQFFYLNQRYIRDRVIFRSVAQAYSDFIPAQRYPIILLFLTMSPEEFDVNVHPTKIEVKFRNAWAIHDLIIKTIRKALMSQPEVVQSIPVPGGTTSDASTPPDAQLPEDSRVLQAMVDFFAGQNKAQPAATIPFRPPVQYSGPTASQAPTSSLPQEVPVQTAPEFPRDRRFCQVHNTYIVEDIPEGLLIIDQHALHERILYNRFKRSFQETPSYRQQLLIPVTVELEPGQFALLNEAKTYLTRLGFEIEEFGRHTVSVRAVPALVSQANITELIQEAFNSISESVPNESARGESSQRYVGMKSEQVSTFGKDDILDKLIRLMSCKAAIKAGERLNDEQIIALLNQREETDYSLTCPHGRPAIFKLTLNQLAKYFQRK